VLGVYVHVSVYRYVCVQGCVSAHVNTCASVHVCMSMSLRASVLCLCTVVCNLCSRVCVCVKWLLEPWPGSCLSVGESRARCLVRLIPRWLTLRFPVDVLVELRLSSS
jgi:hypothetical protein